MRKILGAVLVLLLAFGSNLYAQVDISGDWSGTCVSANSGSTYNATATFSQSGNDVTGTITIFLRDGELAGEVVGTVSDYKFTGTFDEGSEDCPDPTPFEYEISKDDDGISKWLDVEIKNQKGSSIFHGNYRIETGNKYYFPKNEFGEVKKAHFLEGKTITEYKCEKVGATTMNINFGETMCSADFMVKYNPDEDDK